MLFYGKRMWLHNVYFEMQKVNMNIFIRNLHVTYYA